MTNPYQQTSWSLADLFPAHNSPEMESAFQQIESQVASFEARRPQLTPAITASDFCSLVEQLESIYMLATRIDGFASLWFAGSTQDQAAQNFLARVNQALAGIENRVLFFSLWWKGLDDENAARLTQEAGKYHHWLEDLRLFKPHTLSELEEKIINIKDVTGTKALTSLYDTLTNRYVFKLEVDGEMKELTRGELKVYERHHDPDLRSRAYQEEYRVYGADSAILGQMYQTRVRDWRNEQVDLRHFKTPISARNLQNSIPDDVVDTLLEVCQRNATVFQRYFRLKARRLGMDRLRRYDAYAPVAKADKRFEFNQAAEIVLDSFTGFDPRFAELAERVFAQNHLDSQVRKGKRGGAFCASIAPGLTPWVLLNYQGRSDDVATMAHELGHAIHALLAADHTQFTYHASLPLAETASTFGEIVLVDRLLKEETDQSVRQDLLFRQLDDAYATIGRQAFFALFEREAHEQIAKGAGVEELADLYMANLRQQFGDSVDVSEEFRWEWISIPHIYQVPFYVYAYAFGQLLVFALYRQFKQEGESFKPRYLKILSAGGSDTPEKILAGAGIDIHSPAFWQGGFDVVSEMVDALEGK